MADIRPVTPEFATAPQLQPQEIAAAAVLGYRLLINNRPDGEAPDQPSSDDMAAAAEAAGMDYYYVPVRGGPTMEQVDAVLGIIDEAPGPVLAFCRSGTRSIVTWAQGQKLAGLKDREELIELGAKAGYDLSQVV